MHSKVKVYEEQVVSNNRDSWGSHESALMKSHENSEPTIVTAESDHSAFRKGNGIVINDILYKVVSNVCILKQHPMNDMDLDSSLLLVSVRKDD